MAASLRLTIEALTCPISGTPSEMPRNILPSNGSIIRYWRLLANPNTHSKSGGLPSRHEVVAKVAKEVIDIWFTSSIPTIALRSIEKRINVLIDLYKSFQKSMKRDANKEKFEEKSSQFQARLNELLDISACKCNLFEKCRCIKGARVPKEEQVFLNDQRGARKMIICGVDLKANNRYMKKIARNKNSNKDAARTADIDYQISTPINDSDDDGANDSNGDELQQIKDPSFEIDPARREAERNGKYNTLKIKNLAVACERTGVSDRSAAMLASAILEDVQIIKPSSSDAIIDRRKISRQRKNARAEHLKVAAEVIESNSSIGLYFDGKKDETLTAVTKGPIASSKLSSEEHVTIILEPNSVYKCHVTPKSGSAKNLASAILDDMGTSMDTIRVIGSDGTNVNVGRKGGVIVLMEEKLKRTLQWCICLLHMNELPLRALVKSLDGDTTGPKSFTGPLGKLLMQADTMPIVKFDPIPSEPLSVVPNELSTDQKYLFRMYEAVSIGTVSESSLAVRDPGNVCHSRRLMTANRFLSMFQLKHHRET